MAQSQLIKQITAVIGLGLFAYVFLFFAQAATKVIVWRTAATCQTSGRALENGVVALQNVNPAECVGAWIPVAGDTVVTVADSAASVERWNAYLDAPQKAETLVPIEFRHDGEIHRTAIQLRVPSTAEFLLVCLMQGLRFLIALLFMSVALWAFFERPDSAAVRALALFSFAITAFAIANVEALSDRWAMFQLPYAAIVRQFLSVFALCFSAFWLSLAMQFPHPVRLMRERPVIAYLLCYLPTGLLIVLSAASHLFGWKFHFGVPFLVVLAAQVLAGLAILAARQRHMTVPLERRQTRLVLWGTGTGLALFLTFVIVAQAFQAWFFADPKRTLIFINISFLGLLLSPVTYAYAFGRYRLLEVEARLRRGTRYAITMAIMLVGLAAIAWAGSSFVQQASTLGSVWGLAILSLLSLGLITGARAARGIIVDRIYPERRRLRHLFRDFLQSSYAITDANTFWMQLESHLQDGLMVDGVYPLIRKAENGAFCCREGEHTPFHADSDLAQRLERERRPIMVDEAVASAHVQLSAEELGWLSARRIAVVLPLLAHSRLVGFLGLGMKTEHEDYAAEELRLLDSLAPQVALASENIRLLEENVDKKRLEEQLEMARRVQHGFLPRQIPLCPGLELAARCRFCLEVAGDYYDIIPLPSGETVLAVGDVSGKGAGAALLMANLQASLRTAVGMGIPLIEIVSRINELIHRNTPPEQFITFFVGVFDPGKQELSYVNAGHNPPFLIRAGGAMETLDEGGLILGTFTGIAYKQGIAPLYQGDLLLMYTDGVSEAMNERDEEFGEEAMHLIARRNIAAPPEILMDQIEHEVLRHHGSDLLEDDFTLLLAKVK